MKRKVKIMTKITSALTAASMLAVPVPTHAEGETVLWRCTTDGERWVEKEPLAVTGWDNDTALYIDVDQNTRYQTLTDAPWGGCFNERGWAAMSGLTDEQRGKIAADLFGDQGLDLQVGRLPLGNSDFSVRNDQSYDELPDGVYDDYDMKYFSIDNDRENLLPYIREAQAVRPELRFWASPWSPPAWMKLNGSVPGPGPDNTLNFTPEVLTAYAEYFAKYIEAYKNEGIDVSRVMPQNEPTINVGYPSCVWSGEQLNVFIRDYLYPTLREHGLDTEIYLGTFTDSQAGLADPTLNDPVTGGMIKGVGFQWWSAQLAKRVYRQNRDIGYTLMQSETKCGNGGNTWLYGEEHFDCLKEFFEAGVNEYMLWNMVLDEKGVNTNPNPWPQNAPIIVNSVTNEVVYTPMYYVFRHFSAYIHGGARRIKTEGNYGDKIAFQNTDGENVLVVKNNSDMYLDVAINFNGRKVKPTVPPHSVNTFRIAGDNAGFDGPDATYSASGEEEKVDTMVKLFNYNSPSKSLSVSQARFDNGAELLAWDDRGAAEQQWILRPADGEWYSIESFNSEKVMGVWSGSTAPGEKTVQWDSNGSYDQQWRFIPILRDGRTWYKIQNRNSLLYLTYGEGEVADGALAIQSEDSDSDALLWEARVSQGDGLEEAESLRITDAVRDGERVSCRIICGQTGTYTVYCASFDGNGGLLSVTSEDISLSGGHETEFTAQAAPGAERVSVYGWFKGGMSPAVNRTDI